MITFSCFEMYTKYKVNEGIIKIIAVGHNVKEKIVFALHPEIEVVLSNEFSPTNLANEKFCKFQKKIRIFLQV